MPQISLYVDELTLQKIEHAAQAENLSISKWVSSKIRQHMDPNFSKEFKSLFGAIQDDSFVEPREIDLSSDSKRENL